MPVDRLEITTEPVPGKQATYLRIKGDLDAHTFEDLQEALAIVFEERGYYVALDMSGVPYMSSAGAGVLIGALAQVEQNGGRLLLVSLRPDVTQIFKTLGIADIFPAYASRAAAIVAL